MKKAFDLEIELLSCNLLSVPFFSQENLVLAKLIYLSSLVYRNIYFNTVNYDFF